MTPRSGFGLAVILSVLLPVAAQAQTEIINFTADVTSSLNVDAGTVINGSILFAPTNPTVTTDLTQTTSYLTLDPSVFSITSNGAWSDSAALFSVISQPAAGDQQPGSLTFNAGSDLSAFVLNFNGLLNGSNNEGAPGTPWYLSDWQGGSFTYEAVDPTQGLKFVTADVTSLNVSVQSAPEMNVGAASGALLLLGGLIAISRGRRPVPGRAA